MRVGILKVELYLGTSSSLKQKRGVLRGLKARLRNKFNVSVAEVGEMDKWQRASLAIVVVSNDKKHLCSYIDGIAGFIEREDKLMVIDRMTEIL